MQLCSAMPAAELCHPFGDDTAVFKVVGKMFALVDLRDSRGSVTLKADPGLAAALVRQHPQVSPGYHMDKRHWITIELDDAAAPPLPEGLVEDLVEDSYGLVVARLPVRLRPPGPAPDR